jgi:Cdc6-like AAA superfamily ATPase
MHPKYNVVYKHLYDAIISSVTPLIIMLYGPTGIGKSTLCNHLKNQLTNEFSGNPGIIPAVYVEVPNQAPKNFDWKFFFRRFLEALDEVLIELKRDLSHPREHNTKLFHHQRSQTIMDLRQSVVSAIRNRKPYVVFLDEAQTIQNIANPKGMEGQMDSIKSLASDTKDFGTKYVLAFLLHFPVMYLQQTLVKQGSVFREARNAVPQNCLKVLEYV